MLERGPGWTVEVRSAHPVDNYAGVAVAPGPPSRSGDRRWCYRWAEFGRHHRRAPAPLGLHLPCSGAGVTSSVSAANPDQLGRHLDDAGQTLQVAPVPLEIMGTNGRLRCRPPSRCGWRAPSRNAPGVPWLLPVRDRLPQQRQVRRAPGALPQACARGLWIISRRRVERILHRARRALWRLRRPDGTTLDVLADAVVVAAGAGRKTRQDCCGAAVLMGTATGHNLTLRPAATMLARLFDI